MQQQLSVITLGIADLARSKRFYGEGFGWTPVFENEEIAFYQMNGFVLGTWLADKLDEDSQRTGTATPGKFALAHNAPDEASVDALIEKLGQAGGNHPPPRRCAAPRRLSRLCRRSRRSCVGDRVQPGMVDRRRRAGDVWGLRLVRTPNRRLQ